MRLHLPPLFIADDMARITAQAFCPKPLVKPPIISGKTGAPFSHLPNRWEGEGRDNPRLALWSASKNGLGCMADCPRRRRATLSRVCGDGRIRRCV